MIETLAQNLPQLLVLGALLVVSGFFSGSETALFSLRPHQLRDAGAPLRMAGALLRQPRDLLVTILIGNMTVNVAYFSVSVILSSRLAEGRGGALAFGVGMVLLLVLIVVGEVLPKGIATRIPRAWAGGCAYPLTLFSGAVAPARWVLGRMLRPIGVWLERVAPPEANVTADELRMMIELSESAGILDERENELMQRVLQLREMRVKEVMVPRVDIHAFNLNRGRDDFLEVFARRRNSKVPVYRVSIDEVEGILYATDVHFSDEPDLTKLVRKVPFIPETKTVESLLRDFREQGLRAAIVVDEYGGTEGFVTLEDILEAIIGEIEDEYDHGEEPIRQVSEGSYLLAGQVSIREWRQIFGVDLPAEGVETIAGFIVFSLGRLPEEGDTVRYRSLTFTVKKMVGRRVHRILVEASGPPAAAEAEGEAS